MEFPQPHVSSLLSWDLRQKESLVSNHAHAGPRRRAAFPPTGSPLTKSSPRRREAHAHGGVPIQGPFVPTWLFRGVDAQELSLATVSLP